MSDADCESRGDRAEGAGRLRRRRQGSGDGHRDGAVVVVEDGGNDTVMSESVVKEDPEQGHGKRRTQNEAEVSIKQEVGDAADETQWVLRSPRASASEKRWMWVD